MKLIKSGPAFPLRHLLGEDEEGIQTLVSPGFESANLKCSARCSFSFLHFLHIKLLFLCFKAHRPQKYRSIFQRLRLQNQSGVFPTLTESFAECIVVIIMISIIVFFAACLVFTLPFTKCCITSQSARVSSPIYGGLEKRRAEIFIFCCVCAAATSEFVHFVDCAIVCVCVCVSLCVHASVFHLTIHPGPGSICLSDHLM